MTENLKPVPTKKRHISVLFTVMVILPTLMSAIYFSLWASDQYISRSSFVVRSSNTQQSLSGLGAFLQSAGVSRAQDDTYAVREYLTSRTALASLTQHIPVRQFYEDKGDIFSRFNGFGLTGEQEAFYQYYTQKVQVDFDAISGISKLNVVAFDAKEAQQINQLLLKQTEELINQLNDRARTDTVRFAEANVKTAEAHAQEAAEKLMQYRLKHGVFDLNAQSEVQMNLISKLQDELIQIQTQLDQVKALTPDNPQITSLTAREKSLRKEIAVQMRSVAGAADDSLAAKMVGYQRVALEDQFAKQQLANAMASFENAKAEAERKQLYLEIVEQPSQPDLADLPKRIYNILATLLMSLITYGIVKLMVASVREHKN